MDGEKHITPKNFVEYLRKSNFSKRIEKFIMTDFYERDFMKGIVIL